MILENMNIFSYIYTKESYKDTIDNKIPRIFSNSFLFYNNSSEFVNLFFFSAPMRGTSFSNRLTDWPRASSYEPRLVLAVELPAQPSVVQHSSNQNFNFNWIITHPIRDLIPPEVDAPHRDLGGREINCGILIQCSL